MVIAALIVAGIIVCGVWFAMHCQSPSFAKIDRLIKRPLQLEPISPGQVCYKADPLTIRYTRTDDGHLTETTEVFAFRYNERIILEHVDGKLIRFSRSGVEYRMGTGYSYPTETYDVIERIMEKIRPDPGKQKPTVTASEEA